MVGNDLFRVSFLGGYNKADVDEYVRSMENEIESVKTFCKKEKNDLVRRYESKKETSESQLLEKEEELKKASQELQDAQDDLKEKSRELLDTQDALKEKNQKLMSMQEELEGKSRELLDTQEELKGKSRELLDIREELQEKSQELFSTREELEKKSQELLDIREELKKISGEVPDTQEEQKTELPDEQDQDEPDEPEEDPAAGSTETDALLLENQTLRQELLEKSEELRNLQQQYERLQAGEQKDGFLDQNMIAEIMKEARENAKLIKEETLKERDKMLDAARSEAEELKSELLLRMNSELEDKGIQLIAAKHKIAQYMKEVKFAEEGLYNIYSRMNGLVDSMNIRLDNYWEGEKYKMLEDALHENKYEHKEGN